MAGGVGFRLGGYAATSLTRVKKGGQADQRIFFLAIASVPFPSAPSTLYKIQITLNDNQTRPPPP